MMVLYCHKRYDYYSKGSKLAVSVRKRDRDEGIGHRLAEDCYIDHIHYPT